MPVRSSRAMIPLDILDKIADDPEGFKAAIREFEKAQEASRAEAEKTARLTQETVAAIEGLSEVTKELEQEANDFEKNCEKRNRALARDEKRSAGRAIDLDQRERKLDGRDEEQERCGLALDERETSLDTGETALHARATALNARDAELNAREADLKAGEAKLRDDVRDLNDRLSGFRMSA